MCLNSVFLNLIWIHYNFNQIVFWILECCNIGLFYSDCGKSDLLLLSCCDMLVLSTHVTHGTLFRFIFIFSETTLHYQSAYFFIAGSTSCPRCHSPMVFGVQILRPSYFVCPFLVLLLESTKTARKETTPMCLCRQTVTPVYEPQWWHHFCLISG